MAPRQAVRTVQRVVQRVVQRPQAVRRLAAPLVATARRVTPRGQVARVVSRVVTPVARRAATAAPLRRVGVGAVGGGRACPTCRGRTVLARGPVTINLRCR
jgi:hypothetical protein